MLQETLLCNKEPLLWYKDPLLYNKEPLLCHQEPLFCNKKLLLCSKEPLVYSNEPLLYNKELLSCNKSACHNHDGSTKEGRNSGEEHENGEIPNRKRLRVPLALCGILLYVAYCSMFDHLFMWRYHLGCGSSVNVVCKRCHKYGREKRPYNYTTRFTMETLPRKT